MTHSIVTATVVSLFLYIGWSIHEIDGWMKKAFAVLGGAILISIIIFVYLILKPVLDSYGI